MGKYNKIISGILLAAFMTVTFAPSAKAGFLNDYSASEEDYVKGYEEEGEEDNEEAIEAITDTSEEEDASEVEYPYAQLEEPATVEGFEYELKDNVEFLPEETDYELEAAPVVLPNQTKKGSEQIPSDSSEKGYLPGTSIMKLKDAPFEPEENKIYIDSMMQNSYKVIDKILVKEDSYEIPVVKPTANEVFKGFYIPNQTIALTKGNITDLEEGVTLEDPESLQSLSVSDAQENSLPPADNSRSYHEFTIPSKVLYEYPEKPDKEEQELPKGKSDASDEPTLTPTPTPYPEDRDAKDTGKESLKIQVKLQGGKIRIYEPTLVAEADWDGDFDLGFRSMKVESTITLEGNIKFSKEVCVRLYGYGVDFGSDTEIMGKKINAHIGIGIYAIFGINGEITITAKIEQAGEINGGVKGNFWPVLLGVPSAIPYASYNNEKFDVAVMLDAKIHAWAYVGPQLTLDILDFNLLTIQVWVGVEGDALVTAEASTEGTGSMQMDLSLDFVVLFRAWVFDFSYEKYLIKANIYKNSFSFVYGETVSADSAREKNISPVIKLDGVDAYWDTIWGSVSYYDEFYSIQPISDIPVSIDVTKNNGSKNHYRAVTDSDGNFSLQISNGLTPLDRVMITVDHEIATQTSVVKYHAALKEPVHPAIPFVIDLMKADGYNDMVSGTVSPAGPCPGHPEPASFNGTVKISILDENDNPIRTNTTTAKDGVFTKKYTKASDLSGGHKAYAIISFEGASVQSEFVEADLDALKLNVGCQINGSDVAELIAAMMLRRSFASALGIKANELLYAGTVTNLAGEKPYEGNVSIEILTAQGFTDTAPINPVYLNTINSFSLVSPGPGKPARELDEDILDRMKTRVSTFDGSYGTDLFGDKGAFIKGIIFTIEYEDMRKVVRYIFTQSDDEIIVTGSINPVDSILLDKIESRINPADVVLTMGASQMNVNGTLRQIDGASNTSIQKIGTTLYIPAQAVTEVLGGSFTYSVKTGKATISLNNKTAQLWNGKTTAKIGSSSKKIKAAPYLTKTGVLMIPVNMLSDYFGYKTTWDSTSLALTIIKR